MQIGEIQKGKDKIIVSRKEFKGREYVDIRVHFTDADGNWIPTKKGVSLSLESLDEMIGLLEKAREGAGDD
jgi:hypothetical protein